MSIDVEFSAPGPGEWAVDRSHYPGGATPISQWLLTEGMRDGFDRVFRELGVPAERIDAAFVNGFMYTRLRPLIGADKPARKLPPTPILWLASRLHPAFRARMKQAAKTIRDRPSNDVVRQWEDEIRPRLLGANLRFQHVDLTATTDRELQEHVTAVLDHLRAGIELHFWLHGHDLGPVARYLHAALGWGLDPAEAIRALAGASPSTSRPTERLLALRAIVESSGVEVATLDDIRAISDEAAELLDGHLEDHGHVLATGYDLTASTLIELPETVIDSILHARRPPTHDHEAMASALRAQVPNEYRASFDDYLSDARHVMDMRDDNGPMTAEWPLGLLRRALLEAGRRLTAQSKLERPEHALELTPSEANSLFDTTFPTAEAVSARAQQRVNLALLDPPATLGDPEPQPPLEVLPKVLGELIAMTQVAIRYMGLEADPAGDAEATDSRLTGVGIGSESYTGRACVTSSADDAIDRLEPGDVLIVRATSPAFNSVLAIAGAVVTTDGGMLSHAAVLARELGIPAVIGAPGALSITDASMVEVDPVAGAVRVMSPQA